MGKNRLAKPDNEYTDNDAGRFVGELDISVVIRYYNWALGLVMRHHSSEKELVHLPMAIVSINGWNGLAVTFGFQSGTYRPAIRHDEQRRVPGPGTSGGSCVCCRQKLVGDN